MAPNRLRILGWKAEGLRCPDHELSFERNEASPYPITLVQMPNGTGKTTTLKLLRAALSGAADVWTEAEVQSLRKEGSDRRSGTFLVNCLHNESRVTLEMRFDFETNRVTYGTTLPSGKRPGFSPPTGLQRFLRPSLVNFFVFDGELAEHLLDSAHSDAEAAVTAFFQLNHISEIAERIEEYWLRKTEGRGALEPKGFNRRKNRVDYLRKRIVDLKKARALHQDKQTSLKARLSASDKKVREVAQEQKGRKDSLSKTEEALNEAKGRVSQASGRALGRMRDPQALLEGFADRLLQLKQSFDRAKLPQTAAREFFQELAEEPDCVCGRALDDATRQAVRVRAAQYLGSDEVALLNKMKGDIVESIGNDPHAHAADLTGQLDELRDLMRLEDEARTKRDLVKETVFDEHPELESERKAMDQTRDELAKVERQLERFEDPTDSASDEDTYGLKVLERRLDEAERSLAEITDTLNLRAKRLVAGAILEDSLLLARKELCDHLRTESNQRIKRLMPNNRLTISSIGSSLVLEGKDGASVGETLALAYAFLSTLFNRTDHILPFIVDSPANPIDLAVRKEVAHLIPELADQFIAFTISSERSHFVDGLRQTRKPIQYITLFRQGAAPTSREDEKKAVRTLDGLVIQDQAFFDRFHLDEEVAK